MLFAHLNRNMATVFEKLSLFLWTFEIRCSQFIRMRQVNKSCVSGQLCRRPEPQFVLRAALEKANLQNAPFQFESETPKSLLRKIALRVAATSIAINSSILNEAAFSAKVFEF